MIGAISIDARAASARSPVISDENPERGVRPQS